MKTSKKLLSFFLAVLMMVTTCSVGFTAFAAEKDNGLWKDSTSADTTFDALTSMVNTYAPQLFNNESVKALLEDKLGMTITPDTSVSDVIAGLSPTLLGVLGGKGDKNAIISAVDDGYDNTVSPFWYTYLDDPEATMDFFALYQFCKDNQVSTNAELKKYCEETFPKLQNLLVQYYEKNTQFQTDLGEQFDVLSALFDRVGNQLGENGEDISAYTLNEMKAITVSYPFDGSGTPETLSLNDLDKKDEYASIKGLYTTFNNYLKASDSDLELKTVADLFYYVMLGYGDEKGEICESIWAHLCKLGGSNYADVINSTTELNNATMKGVLVYTAAYGSNEDLTAKITNDLISDDQIAQFKSDITAIVPNTGVSISGNGKWLRQYLKGEDIEINSSVTIKNNYNSGLSESIKAYWAAMGDTQLQAIGTAVKTGSANGKTLAQYIQEANDSITSYYFKQTFGATYNFNASGAMSLYTTLIDNQSIDKSCKKFKYADFKVPDELAVQAVNEILNKYINQYLDPTDSIGSMITGVVDTLLQTKVDLKATLNDIYINLYNEPVETLFKLLPLVVTVLDELFEPLVLNGTGDNYNNKGRGFLYDILCDVKGEAILSKYTQELGSKTGIGALAFDLNKLLPDLMHWLLADSSYTFTYYNVTDNGDDTLTYNTPTNGLYDLSKTPVITNIYVADKALQYAKISDIGKKLGTAGGEAVAEIATFFSNAVDTYLNGHAGDIKSIASNGSISNRGLNNIFVALPQLLDIMGKNFVGKYDIKSDWSYSDYKITETDATNHIYKNESLESFKALSKDAKPEDVLDQFVNIFVNDWFNALVDLLNDTTATSNKITSNIPLITGLLQALGGLGEKSVLSDVLNGVFQLNYNDDASFALKIYNDKTGYVGISTKSAYFLLSNIGQLVNVITSIDTKKKNTVTEAFKSYKPGTAGKTVTWAKAPKTASKSGSSFLSKLDAMLSGVLEKSSINNFNLNTTTGIASGVISLVSYLLGSDNSNQFVQILNEYFNQLNERDKKSTDTSKKKVYTEKNLTNLVVQTYTLIENALDYYLTSQDSIGINVFYDTNQKVYSNNGSGRYVYNILTAALKGLISPHALSNHITTKSVATKLASLDSWHSAIKADKHHNGVTGTTNITLNWGFGAGDTTKFFSSFGESLGIITELAGVLFCNAGYYKTIVYPILSDIDYAQQTNLGVTSPTNVKTGTQALVAIINPVGKLLEAFYSKPATVLMDITRGMARVMDKHLVAIEKGLFQPLNNEIKGISTILSSSVSNLMPTLSKNDKWFTDILQSIIYTKDKDGNLKPTSSQKNTYNTILGVLRGTKTYDAAQLISLVNKAVKNFGIVIPTTFYKDLASCKDANAALTYIEKFVINLLTNPKFINLLKTLIDDSSVSQLLDMIGRLTYDDLKDIIDAVISKTTDPTDAYWTFLQYVQEKTTGFYYPANVTAADADDAVDQLDNLVTQVFALLNGLDVVDQSNLKDLVTGLVFTNENLTKLTKLIYGNVDKLLGNNVMKSLLPIVLTDSSYGKTYSSAAKAIKSAKSWNKLGKVNWGFTDGSAKAETAFVNSLAAILRPFNSVFTVLLAGDSIEIGQTIKFVVDQLKLGSAKDTVSFKNGILTIRVNGTDRYSKTSIIKLDINAVVKQVENLKLYGGNGYESAIVPLLEAFECDGVKSYKQYKSDINKAKDSVILDVLNPIVGLVNDVLDAPFDTLTAILPNVAYFIDNNGLAQLINNLLSPVTSLLPVLKDNNLDVNVIIKAIAGKSLNSIVTDALGVNIHLDLNNLNKCDIQNAVVPLVNSLIKKYKLQLPSFKWSEIASHGTVSTVSSMAKNSQGNYTRKHVTADQGETLVAVLRYVANLLVKNTSGIKSIIGGIDKIKKAAPIINSVLNQVSTASADQIIQAVFYFLQEEPANAFWNYSDYKTKDYKFSYPTTVDVDFLKNISPMLDGLISGLLPLNEKISGLLFKDSLINGMIKGIGNAMDGVKINDSTSLTDLLAQTNIDYSTKNFAKLLNDSEYGATYSSNASIIGSASKWSSVNFDSMKWGVKDRASFFNALCAALRPFYGVLDVLLNDASLGLFDIVYIPGSNGYTSCVVPLLEAFSGYNIKTQYQYRQDINKAYDNILLDIVNPIWDKVEDILNAPLQTLMAMLPNLALFIANDGLLQLIENLFTPVSALLDAVKPIVDVNDVLDKVFDMLGFDLNKTLAKVGLSLNLNINVYDLSAMLKPIIGAENIVPLLNKVLGIIKIGGKPLGIELMDIDWYQLASHGTYVKEASQAATYGVRVHVNGDASETLVALLRYLIKTVNYKDNYNVINNLIASLLGEGVQDSIKDVIGQVLGMLKGETDDVVSQLCNLLQTLN